MQVIREVENYTSGQRPLFLALGNFDGVHWGHKKLISTLLERARMAHGTAAAFIFEPHPSNILTPGRAPKLLVKAEQKAELLRELGMDLLIYHSFNLEMARWSPEEFVQKVLLERLHVQEVFVGFNYSFGHKGAGTPEMLQAFGEKHGFLVHIISPVTIEGELVSSTLVRTCLDEGNVEKAFRLLGYYPFLEGSVAWGEGRGRTIGIPTANLQVDGDINVPATGVYAARATFGGLEWPCVVNIGRKPTFHENDYPVSIEAHIIGFDGDIYGRNLRLTFLKRLRGEEKFDSVEDLVKQIKKDRTEARDYLENFS